jgi:hypothetical protein
MDQLMPVPAGKGSLSVTPVAGPAVEASATVMVKPMVVPAGTGVASAVFVMDSFGAIAGWTTMVADALTLGAFEAEAVAVLLSVIVVAQVELVALEMWTLTDAPGARLPKLQLRSWDPTEPVTEQVPGPL